MKILSNRPPSSLSRILSYLVVLFLLIHLCNCRRHHLILHNDIRRYFPVSTFGYFTGGSLEITVDKFRYYPDDLDENVVSNQFGFSLARTLSNNISPYIDGQYSQQSCTLNQDIDYFNDNFGLLLMKLDIKNNTVSLQCNPELSKLTIFSSEHSIVKRSGDILNVPNVKPVANQHSQQVQVAADQQQDKPQEDDKKILADDENFNNSGLSNFEKNIGDINNEKQSAVVASAIEAGAAVPEDSKNQPAKIAENKIDDKEVIKKTDHQPEQQPPAPPMTIIQSSRYPCYTNFIEIKRISKPNDGLEFSFKFKIFIAEQQYEGLYALHFHNCLNYPKKIQELDQYTSIDLDMHIVEKNLDNYLSAGEIPLPQLFFALSIIFFILGAIWFVSIRSRYEETFKIHYLMGVLVFVKALSLLFHSINYHFIAKEGSQVETWAVLYYVTHFLKGALLFITIVLIGTGWAFIKHILNDKDKKIFMIVIPLQVIANIANIITEESEEGALIHTVWREIFILVDMICCGAILFPVIWSIRHLQEASATDGKAAINLKKLQLFRFFYVMIVFYIYFTRIIVYLVKITVPFNYEWLDAFFQHAATLVFFILTGYHFQPTTSNPYYQLLQDDIEMDEEVLFIQPSTFSEAKKRNRDLESGDVQNLLNNSHDYD